MTDGINTHLVGAGPVQWDFVDHPPAPTPTIKSSLKGIGSTYPNLQGSSFSKSKMGATIGVAGVAAYAGWIAKENSAAKKLFGMSAVTFFLGTLWSMS